QVLTDKQIQVVCKNNFELDYFSEGIVLTKEKMEAYGVTEAQIRGPKRLREICIDKDYKFP
ncbi:hypothetical protein ACHI3A_15335, partial [Listeria monocytogenes]